MRVASSSESHARSCVPASLPASAAFPAAGGQSHHSYGAFFAFKAIGWRQVGAALSVGDGALQRQNVKPQQAHFRTLHGLAGAQMLHKDRARSVPCHFNGQAHFCDKQQAGSVGNGFIAAVSGQLYAHEAVHRLLAAAQQGGQIKHGKGRSACLFLAYLNAAFTTSLMTSISAGGYSNPDSFAARARKGSRTRSARHATEVRPVA